MSAHDPSFAELFGAVSSATKTEKSAKSCLEEWYDRIYDVPLSLFSIEDLARSCRQKLFPDRIVPLVLQTLQRDPLAGEMYEGELFNALTILPLDFWKRSRECRKNLRVTFDLGRSVLSDGLEENDFVRLRDFVTAVDVLEE